MVTKLAAQSIAKHSSCRDPLLIRHMKQSRIWTMQVSTVSAWLATPQLYKQGKTRLCSVFVTRADLGNEDFLCVATCYLLDRPLHMNSKLWCTWQGFVLSHNNFCRYFSVIGEGESIGNLISYRSVIRLWVKRLSFGWWSSRWQQSACYIAQPIVSRFMAVSK